VFGLELEWLILKWYVSVMSSEFDEGVSGFEDTTEEYTTEEYLLGAGKLVLVMCGVIRMD
jgi:hypothetical protein